MKNIEEIHSRKFHFGTHRKPRVGFPANQSLHLPKYMCPVETNPGHYCLQSLRIPQNKQIFLSIMVHMLLKTLYPKEAEFQSI